MAVQFQPFWQRGLTKEALDFISNAAGNVIDTAKETIPSARDIANFLINPPDKLPYDATRYSMGSMTPQQAVLTAMGKTTGGQNAYQNVIGTPPVGVIPPPVQAKQEPAAPAQQVESIKISPTGTGQAKVTTTTSVGAGAKAGSTPSAEPATTSPQPAAQQGASPMDYMKYFEDTQLAQNPLLLYAQMLGATQAPEAVPSLKTMEQTAQEAELSRKKTKNEFVREAMKQAQDNLREQIKQAWEQKKFYDEIANEWKKAKLSSDTQIKVASINKSGSGSGSSDDITKQNSLAARDILRKDFATPEQLAWAYQILGIPSNVPTKQAKAMAGKEQQTGHFETRGNKQVWVP